MHRSQGNGNDNGRMKRCVLVSTEFRSRDAFEGARNVHASLAWSLLPSLSFVDTQGLPR